MLARGRVGVQTPGIFNSPQKGEHPCRIRELLWLLLRASTSSRIVCRLLDLLSPHALRPSQLSI